MLTFALGPVGARQTQAFLLFTQLSQKVSQFHVLFMLSKDKRKEIVIGLSFIFPTRRIVGGTG